MRRPRKVPAKTVKVIKGSAPDEQDACTKRIEECQIVLEHLEHCPAWEVIQRDLRLGKEEIDDKWHLYPENDPRLREDRITKLAYMHLLSLKAGYEMDLETAKKRLDVLQNTDKKIIKDYDPN